MDLPPLRITVAIRYADGRITIQYRRKKPDTWHVFRDPRLLSNDQPFVDAWLKSNGEDPPATTPCPGAAVALCPGAYGIVVYDHVANRLISLQDWFNFDKLSAPELKWMLNHDGNHEQANTLLRLIETDRVKMSLSDNHPPTPFHGTLDTLRQHLMGAAGQADRDDPGRTMLHINLKPLTLLSPRHYSAAQNVLDTRLALEQCGIRLNLIGQRAWDDHVRYLEKVAA